MESFIRQLRRVLHSLLYFVTFILIWIAAGFGISALIGLAGYPLPYFGWKALPISAVER